MILLCAANCGYSQFNKIVVYPKGYFRSPLDIPLTLAGNFGELRPNHFHMGFDLKTDHHENMPVHAAADGYIAKIKIEPAGFGRAIYINHPNGLTTVYAHLNAFVPGLEDWITKQQYSRETWRIFADLPPGLFPVKKGDLIAHSGNTGGSQGPHLHFEIRATEGDINLNPVLFGLPFLDDTRPVVSGFAIYDRRRSVYEQVPVMLAVKKSPGGYEPAAGIAIVHTPLVSFGIRAFDTQTGSGNHLGIFEAALYDHEKYVIGFRMDRISYDNTRNINAHIDYRTNASGGPYIQQLFRLPGYLHSIYQPETGDGTIDLTDGAVHQIRIVVKDGYGNASSLAIPVRFRGETPPAAARPGKLFYPFQPDGMELPGAAFFIGEHSLYDSVHIGISQVQPATGEAVSPQFSIGNAGIPLQDSVLIRIRPAVPLDAMQLQRTVMECRSGTHTTVVKVQWQKGWAAAHVRELGKFRLLTDQAAPQITPVGIKNAASLGRASRITLSVRDNRGIVKNFRATLDGKWIRFSNDKGRNFMYIFDARCGRGKHKLQVTAEDEAGNTAQRTFLFTR